MSSVHLWICLYKYIYSADILPNSSHWTDDPHLAAMHKIALDPEDVVIFLVITISHMSNGQLIMLPIRFILYFQRVDDANDEIGQTSTTDNDYI